MSVSHLRNKIKAKIDKIIHTLGLETAGITYTLAPEKQGSDIYILAIDVPPSNKSGKIKNLLEKALHVDTIRGDLRHINSHLRDVIHEIDSGKGPEIDLRLTQEIHDTHTKLGPEASHLSLDDSFFRDEDDLEDLGHGAKLPPKPPKDGDNAAGDKNKRHDASDRSEVNHGRHTAKHKPKKRELMPSGTTPPRSR